MKKVLFISSMTLLIALAINSCSKDDPAPEPKGVIKNYMASDTNIRFGISYYHPSLYEEVGYKFKPLKDGNITHLGLCMSKPGTYIVAIYSGNWNNSASVYAQKEIEQTTYNVWTYSEISPFQVKKDKNYIITVKFPPLSTFNRTLAVTFPLNYKNIQILSTVEHYFNSDDNYYDGKDGQGADMNYLEGVPDFIFVTN